MDNNIPHEDLQHLCDFIIKDPILTNGEKVVEFEKLWSEWLGVKHSVYINSGGSANLMTLLMLPIYLSQQQLVLERLEKRVQLKLMRPHC